MTREQFTPEPFYNLNGFSSADSIQGAYDNLYKGYRTLNVSPGTGKIGVLIFPQYLPTNDLIYSRTEDNPDTTYVDESVQMVNETWPVESRPPLVNFGGHRVGVVGQTMMFDATESQFDEDALPTSFTWSVNDTVVGNYSIMYYTFNSPGLYKVSCKIQNTIGIRYVRILSAWGESDFDVISLGSLSGSVDSGWQVSFDVKDTLTNDKLQPYQGIMLYVYDSLDQSWRRQYNANMRAINRRMKSTSELPPDPLWQATYVGWKEGEESYYVYTEEPKNPLLLQQGCWPEVDYYFDAYIQSQSKYGTPANLGRALACELTGGNKTHPFGKSRVSGTGAEHIRKGMLMLAEYYRDCGKSWKKALKMFLNKTCEKTDTIEWNTTAGKVFDKWTWLDEVGGVGGSVQASNLDQRVSVEQILNVPTEGHVLFFGYVDSMTINETANEVTLKLSVVNSTEMLNKTFQRMETYWESGEHATSGGTVMQTPPMRSATCIHHLLTYHTNFATYHDVILDWSGPRFWATTSPEGTTWQAISGWANNDYAWAFADRYGQLRYMTQPYYKGSQWYAEAIKEAIRIDQKHVIEMQVQELRMMKRTSYVRLCGSSRGGNCEICGEFPCGGPTENSPGEWMMKRGMQYDDYRVLCRYAAHTFAYQNRSYDIQVAMPWRHDLDLGDLVFFPFNDPQNRFLWNVSAPPVFVIKQITHQYDVPSARWITSIVAEQLTYGVACDCDNQTCPVSEESGLCNGDVGCDLIIDPSLWKQEQVVKSSGNKIVPEMITRNGSLVTFSASGSQVTTVAGTAMSTKTEVVNSTTRNTSDITPYYLKPHLYLQETSYQANTGRQFYRSVDMLVPYFTVGAKGPVGGSLKIELKLKAKEKRRSYFHIFYVSDAKPITSETGDYSDGTQVVIKNANTAIYDGPDSVTNSIITYFPINTTLTVNGMSVKTNNQNFYPVLVDIGDFTNGDKAQIRSDNTPVRAQASLSSAFNGYLNSNALVTIVNTPVTVGDLVWYQIIGSTAAGWVSKSELKYIFGWVDSINITGEASYGQENPITDAQQQIPKEMHQTIDAFNLDGKYIVRVATVEQFDYKLRDTKTSDYVDTLSIKIFLPAKDSTINYKFGFVTSSEYSGQSWQTEYSAQEIDAWENVSTSSEQRGACDCNTLQFGDLPAAVQQSIKIQYNNQPPPPEFWYGFDGRVSLQNTYCAQYVSKTCLQSSRVDKTTQEIAVDNFDQLSAMTDKDVTYILTSTEIVGSEASVEIIPGCKDCYDPMSASQNSNDYGYGPKPLIYLLAGHASYNDAGDPTERSLNIEMAKAYKEAFTNAGYVVKWWQEVDGDANPTMSPGNHSTVATGIANLMAANTEDRMILLDLHHEGVPNVPGLFVIVPDGGTEDTWELNNNHVALARLIARNLGIATDLPLRTTGVRETGVMSEKQTGAAEDGGRLSTFYYTQSLRDRAVRLIIEHGNILSPSDMAIINSTGFAKKCAEASVRAVDQMYPETSGVFGCPNWPTLANIEKELNRVTNNGRKSPMASFSEKFLEWGAKYLINPAFVLALCFSESQYGTDGELSVYANNYGGHTYGNASVTLATCGPYSMGGVQWNKYCTPEQGAEALFKFLDKSIYRQSGGTIQDIINIYSPVGTGVLGNSAEAIDQKYEIIKIIGQKLGVTLDKITQIYSDSAECMTTGATAAPNQNYGGYTTMFQWVFKQAGATVTQGPYMYPTHSECDCYDFYVPLGTRIYPIAEGVVTFAQQVYDQYRPWKIIINTAYGFIVYAHLNSCSVNVGQRVYLSTLIGTSGECCDTTTYGGPHLHLGLQGGAANSSGGRYTLTSILQTAGIDLSKFGRSY